MAAPRRKWKKMIIPSRREHAVQQLLNWIEKHVFDVKWNIAGLAKSANMVEEKKGGVANK